MEINFISYSTANPGFYPNDDVQDDVRLHYQFLKKSSSKKCYIIFLKNFVKSIFMKKIKASLFFCGNQFLNYIFIF